MVSSFRPEAHRINVPAKNAKRRSQHPLRFGQDQTQVGDIGKVTEPVDLHNIRGRSLAFGTDLHSPHNSGHASTPAQRTGADIRLNTSALKLAAVPSGSRDLEPRLNQSRFRCCAMVIVGAEDDDVNLLRCALPAAVTLLDRRVLRPVPA